MNQKWTVWTLPKGSEIVRLYLRTHAAQGRSKPAITKAKQQIAARE